jgi:hypothetical protein
VVEGRIAIIKEHIGVVIEPLVVDSAWEPTMEFVAGSIIISPVEELNRLVVVKASIIVGELQILSVLELVAMGFSSES